MSDASDQPAWRRPTVWIACGALLALLWVWGGRFSSVPDPASTHGYFYDLNTDQLFLASNESKPPIASPSGPGRGVRAVMFSCGDCDEREKRFLGWIEQHVPAKQPKAEELVVLGGGGSVSQIAAPPTPGVAPQWHDVGSPQARALQQFASQQCSQPDDRLTTCRPDSADVQSMEQIRR